MKVLFAVNNEEISESIVKKYQKEYKQIISYKNVYYFNAILKELQKDKSYDRIVISEELEAFTHNQYDQIDKFIFEKLDGISDEATDLKGNDIPIILICSERRNKSEQMLVKLFGIGIYNAIIGKDRSVDEICKLINRPRAKKEAKVYYRIESESVNYQSETENDVSEIEIQNILAHYKRLGKNEERYLKSFNNIAAQYNDTQLRIISKFLPLNVRAVLEESSPKYQQIMSFNNSVSDNIRKPKKEDNLGPSEKLLRLKDSSKTLSKPVVIPSSINMNSNKKLARIKEQKNIDEVEPEMKQDVIENNLIDNSEVETKSEQIKHENLINEFKENNITETINNQDEIQPVKRGRGRPRKNPIQTDNNQLNSTVKRGRGRPRKTTIQENEEILPGLTAETTYEEEKEEVLPGLTSNINYQDDEEILPGLTSEATYEEENEEILPGLTSNINYQGDEEILPGLQGKTDYQETNIPIMPETTTEHSYSNDNMFYKQPEDETRNSDKKTDYEIENIDLSYLLTPGKKIVTFVGTSKNGTSFIVNNLAQLLSSMGVNTAILDTTMNRNAYYIYTKNEEELRKIAAHSIDGLANGVANGILVNKNLTVYTSLPDEGEAIINTDKILESLLKKHSLILIDSDFDTPINYFKHSQETYLVQTFDILTIQPLTAFLRELKAKNILEEGKLKIILNKYVKIRGINEKTIIGGMAYYNDPAMSYMTELFDRNIIKHIAIPFEEETYIKYLENIIECEISLKGYSKGFMQVFRELANMVYPINNTYRPPSTINNNTFSPNINNTLNQMKNNY